MATGDVKIVKKVREHSQPFKCHSYDCLCSLLTLAPEGYRTTVLAQKAGQQ